MKKFLLIFFTLIAFVCFSQKNDGDDEINMGLPDFSPVSPNAASLGSFGNVPVGLNTGNPNINIPIYTIQVGDFQFPISLNYTSNGLKVDERESVVGMGWNITNAGIISRQQNDAADHPDLPRILLPNYNYFSEEMRSFLESIANPEPNSRDTQPDIFSYNVNGLNGKFYLNEDWDPVQIEPTTNKIEVLESFYNEQLSGPTFLITSGDGTQYYFGTSASRESSFTRNSCNGIPSEIINNAWYLSEIVLPTGKKIKFEYEIKLAEYLAAISQNYRASVTHIIPHGYIAPESWIYNIPNGISNNLCTLKGINNVAYLRKIIFDDNIIDFYYSNMYSTTNSNQLQKLDSISVKNRGNHQIKFYRLLYNEFVSLSEFDNNDISFTDPTINKRVFLKEITNIIDEEESSYYFEYIQPELLAPRLSYAQDYWGFFNGKDNNSLITNDIDEYGLTFGIRQFFPPDQVNGWFNEVGSDKMADFDFGKRGMLNEITYPTGGKTKLKYESHSVIETQFIKPPITNKSLSVHTMEDWPVYPGEIDSFTTDTIKFSQEGIHFVANVDTNNCWQIGDPDHWINMTLSIYDVTLDSNIGVYKYPYDQPHLAQKILSH